MKPFNLEKAKAGKPVCTREGNPARIICFDRNSPEFPIVGLINLGNHEIIRTYTKDGKHFANGIIDKHDLVMVPEHHVGYVNLYKHDTGYYSSGPVYESKGIAIHKKYIGILDSFQYIDTVKIEWDE